MDGIYVATSARGMLSMRRVRRLLHTRCGGPPGQRAVSSSELATFYSDSAANVSPWHVYRPSTRSFAPTAGFSPYRKPYIPATGAHP